MYLGKHGVMFRSGFNRPGSGTRGWNFWANVLLKAKKIVRPWISLERRLCHSCSSDGLLKCDVFFSATYLNKYFKRFGREPRLLLIIKNDYWKPRRCELLCTSISNILYLISNEKLLFGLRPRKKQGRTPFLLSTTFSKFLLFEETRPQVQNTNTFLVFVWS